MQLAISWTLVWVANLELLLECTYLSVVHAIFFLLGPLGWLVILGFWCNVSTGADDLFTFQGECYGVFTQVLGNSSYWGSFFLSLAMASGSSLCIKLVQLYF